MTRTAAVGKRALLRAVVKNAMDPIGPHGSSAAHHPVSNTSSLVDYTRTSLAQDPDVEEHSHSSLPIDRLQPPTLCCSQAAHCCGKLACATKQCVVDRWD
jgi:hypothetical protein